tara:strand:+ start:893 stop:1216 length:324 start_codon:yes stop_codon:yes gene_type:complete
VPGEFVVVDKGRQIVAPAVLSIAYRDRLYRCAGFDRTAQQAAVERPNPVARGCRALGKDHQAFALLQGVTQLTMQGVPARVSSLDEAGAGRVGQPADNRPMANLGLG